MKQIIIVAADEDSAIGRSDNSFMWKLSNDLKHFKEATTGHPIIMGHTTYVSIGRILPDRHTIILSRKKDLFIEGATVVSSIEAALNEAKKFDDTVFIIGGQEVFDQFISTADLIYLTEVHARVGGDKHFHYDPKQWVELSHIDFCTDENNTYDFTIKKLARIATEAA